MDDFSTLPKNPESVYGEVPDISEYNIPSNSTYIIQCQWYKREPWKDTKGKKWTAVYGKLYDPDGKFICHTAIREEYIKGRDNDYLDEIVLHKGACATWEYSQRQNGDFNGEHVAQALYCKGIGMPRTPAHDELGMMFACGMNYTCIYHIGVTPGYSLGCVLIAGKPGRGDSFERIYEEGFKPLYAILSKARNQNNVLITRFLTVAEEPPGGEGTEIIE